MISVIIPVFNVSAYLGRCLDSVLGQTYEDLEIIVVDDGSTDESPDICDKAAAHDTRVRVVHQENKGLSGARNTGIELAKGDFLAFVDSDDFIHPSMYEILLKSATQTDADMAVSEIARVTETELSVFSFPPVDASFLSISTFGTRQDIFEQLTKRDIQTVVAWTKLYKKYLFEKIRFPVGRLHEDAAIIHEILWKCNRVTYADAKLYYYVRHDSGIMNSTVESEKGIIDGIKAYRDRIEFLLQKDAPELALQSKKMMFEHLRYRFSLLSEGGYTEKCAWLSKQALMLADLYGREGLSAEVCLLMDDARAYYDKMKRMEKTGAFKAAVKRFLHLR